MKPCEYLVSGEEMQRYDSNTITHFKVPGLVLMEQAAMACRDEIIKLYPEEKKEILVLAGKGNNGGDAMALARLLHQNQHNITVCIVSNSVDSLEGFSPPAKAQYDILMAMQVPVVTQLPEKSYDIIIDGIFGVGCNRNIEGNVANVIRQMNQTNAFKISLDIPSGVHATTGKICGIAFCADLTITFAFLKKGLYLLPGARYSGKIVKSNMGITEESFLDQPPQMFSLTGKIREYLPKRDAFGHKGTFGKILHVAGSKQIGGAAILSAKASFFTGCGMVRICTHKEQKSDILGQLPEAMVDGYETESEALEQLEKGLQWTDVIAVGPGIGTDAIAASMVNKIITQSNKPLIMDADSLNLLQDSHLYQALKNAQSKDKPKRKLILTPHPLELARICHCSMEDITEKGMEIAGDLAKELSAVVVKKDARTIVVSREQLALNLSGNSGMATAGSGDVLTGILAALMGFSLSAFETAVLGVYLHGLAGDAAAKDKNEYSLIAGDIIQGISKVLQ